MRRATTDDAFARWETLGPPARGTGGTATSCEALSPPTSFRSQAAGAPLEGAAAAAAAAAASGVSRPNQQRSTPQPQDSSSVSGRSASSLGDSRSKSRAPAPAPPRGPVFAPRGGGDVDLDDGSPARAPVTASTEQFPSSIVEVVGVGGRGGGGSGERAGDDSGGDDAESLLVRLAGKAKRAAAAVLSASAASSGAISPPLVSPPRQNGRDGARPGTAGSKPAAVHRMASVALDPAADAVGGVHKLAGSHANTTAGPGANRQERRRGDDTAEAINGAQAPGPVAGPVAVAVVGPAGARLAELCKEDKAKVARLMQDLVKLRAERDGQKARFERLRGQNDVIVKEMAALKVKFGQSVQLLRKYQSIIQAGLPASGGAVGVDGVNGSHSWPVESVAARAAAAAAAATAENQSLREALRAAEKASRESNAEAAAEQAGRAAMAEELRAAKKQADDLRRHLDSHRMAAAASSATARKATRHGGRLDPPSDGAVGATGIPFGGTTAPSTITPSASAAVRMNPAAADTALWEAFLRAAGRDQAGQPEPDPDVHIRGVDGGSEASAATATDAAAASAAAVSPADCAATSSSSASEQQLPEEGVGRGGLASSTELAALKEQVETLKQQLVMVGVQQLALTGIPTGAALLKWHEGPFPFRDPPPPSTNPSTVDVNPSTGGQQVQKGGGGGGTAVNTGSALSCLPAQQDRGGSVELLAQQHQLRHHHHQQKRTLEKEQEQFLERNHEPRGASRGKEGDGGTRDEQAEASGRMFAGPNTRNRHRGGSETNSGVVRIGETVREESHAGPGEEVAHVDTTTDDEEAVGWWLRSADKLLLVPGDSVGLLGREECSGGSSKSGHFGQSGATSEAHVKYTAADSEGCGQGLLSDKANRHDDAESVDIYGNSTRPEAAAAESGAPRLRVSWSSISVRSSESGLGPELASASIFSNGSSRKNGDGMSSQRRDSDAPGVVRAGPRPRDPRRHQEPQPGRLDGSCDGASPSSFSSFRASSSVFGQRTGGSVAGSSQVGVGINRGVLSTGRRHRSGAAVPGGGSGGDGARRASTTCEKHHSQSKSSPMTPMPLPRQCLGHRAPIAGVGTTIALQAAGSSGKAVATASKSRRAPSHRRFATTVEFSRESGGDGGGGGSARGSSPSSSSSSSVRQAGVENGWQAATRPERARHGPQSASAAQATRVAPGVSKRDEGWVWRGPPENGRDRRQGATAASDGDPSEVLPMLGGDDFFDGSLLDLIDDLEEEDRGTMAAEGSARSAADTTQETAEVEEEAAQLRRRGEAARSGTGSRRGSAEDGRRIRDGGRWGPMRGETFFDWSSSPSRVSLSSGNGGLGRSLTERAKGDY